MVSWWWAIPAVVGVLGVLVLFGGLRSLFSGKIFSGGMGSLLGGGLAAAAVALALLGLNIQTYARLTYERPVATIDLKQVSPQFFEATIVQPGTEEAGATARTYPLHGDEWRIEALVLKWKPWANVLGLDSQYRLDRLSGRYHDTAQEISAVRSVHDLSGRPAADQREWWDLDIFDVARKHQWLQAVDTLYGGGVYMPMADGARYEVWMTQSGMIARPANPAANAASAGGWTEVGSDKPVATILPAAKPVTPAAPAAQ